MGKLFKKGDIVVLKSGGPQMTVENYHINMGGGFSISESDHIVDCIWFDNSNQLVKKSFEQEALKRHEE